MVASRAARDRRARPRTPTSPCSTAAPSPPTPKPSCDRGAPRGASAPGVRSVVMGCASALPRDVAASLAELPDGARTSCRAPISRALADAAIDLPTASALTTSPDAARARCCASRTAATSTAPSARRRSRAARTASRARRRARRRSARASPSIMREIVLTGSAYRQLRQWTSTARSARSSSVSCATCPMCASGCRRSKRRRSTTGCADLLVGEPERVAPHLHAPLQSGSDRVLRRMGRHWYTAADYAAAVERLAAQSADLRPRRRRHHRVSRRDATRITRRRSRSSSAAVHVLHVFPYSARPGTAAARLPEPVAQRLAGERARGAARDRAPPKAAAYAARPRGRRGGRRRRSAGDAAREG